MTQAERDPQGSKTQVSVSGGMQPHWSGNGKELFFVDGDNLGAGRQSHAAIDGGGSHRDERCSGNAGLRDVSLLWSLPGVGRIVAGALLEEAAYPLRQRDYHAISAHGGIAPVTRGRSKQVSMRYRCNTRLRNALYHWARISVQHDDDRRRQRYARLRAAGKSHGRALRGYTIAF
jgi:hypothetical protein